MDNPLLSWGLLLSWRDSEESNFDAATRVKSFLRFLCNTSILGVWPNIEADTHFLFNDFWGCEAGLVSPSMVGRVEKIVLDKQVSLLGRTSFP